MGLPRYDEVSIHALLAECDILSINAATGHMPFQSTHSLRSATPPRKTCLCVQAVSIHALLAECDRLNLLQRRIIRFNPRTPCGVRPASIPNSAKISRFNPRTPCGVRLSFKARASTKKRFQSTHSLRSATAKLFHQGFFRQVSIHALLAECDKRNGCYGLGTTRFQSTHSLRSATPSDAVVPESGTFQSTHSLRSATGLPNITPILDRFQSTHSLRSATFRGRE